MRGEVKERFTDVLPPYIPAFLAFVESDQLSGAGRVLLANLRSGASPDVWHFGLIPRPLEEINRMQSSSNNNKGPISNPLNGVLSLLAMAVVLIGLFYLASFVLKILYWVAPVLFIASLIIDHKVFLGYVGWISKLLKRNLLVGIGSIFLSVFFFPFVSLFLLGSALFKKKIREAEQDAVRRRDGDLIDYEEVDTESLELPRLEKREPPRRDDPKGKYDEFF
jgi:hypothetical protein